MRDELRESGSVSEKEKEALLNQILEKGGSSFPDIMLFNSVDQTGSTAEGVRSFSDIHANLMSLHGFMTGFQFIAIEGSAAGASPGDDHDPDWDWRDWLNRAVFILQLLGFAMSLFGTFLSLSAQEYLKAIELEEPKTIIDGVLKNKYMFMMSDILAVMAGCDLVLTSNLLMYNKLPVHVCIPLNVLSVLMGNVFIYLWYYLILARQPARRIYEARKKLATNDSHGAEEYATDGDEDVDADDNQSTGTGTYSQTGTEQETKPLSKRKKRKDGKSKAKRKKKVRDETDDSGSSLLM